jgi:hypothetical protein
MANCSKCQATLSHTNKRGLCKMCFARQCRHTSEKNKASGIEKRKAAYEEARRLYETHPSLSMSAAAKMACDKQGIWHKNVEDLLRATCAKRHLTGAMGKQASAANKRAAEDAALIHEAAEWPLDSACKIACRAHHASYKQVVESLRRLYGYTKRRKRKSTDTQIHVAAE